MTRPTYYWIMSVAQHNWLSCSTVFLLRRTKHIIYTPRSKFCNNKLVVEVAVLETLRRLRGRKTNNSSIGLRKQPRLRVVFFQGSNSKLIPKALDLLRQFVEPFWARDRSPDGSLPIQGNEHTIKADIFMPCVAFESHEFGASAVEDIMRCYCHRRWKFRQTILQIPPLTCGFRWHTFAIIHSHTMLLENNDITSLNTDTVNT